MFNKLFVILSVWAFAVGADVDPGPEPPCPSDNSIQAYFESKDCTKFWQCSNGVPYLMPCAPGTHWSQELWTCVHIVDSTCTGQGWSSIQPPNTSPNGTVCPPVDGPDSVYFPDDNCTKFWQCSNGVPHLHSCPDGLHFNPSLNVCDWPGNAGCDGNQSNGTQTESSSTNTPKPTTTPTTTTSPNGTVCPLVDGPNSVYFPDDDCPKFWQCSNGVPYQHTCPDGLHFNPSLNVCDWPANAGCDGNQSNGTQTDSSSTNTPKTTTIPTTTTSPNGIVCPLVDGPNSVYFPDDDCTKFWQCSNGVPHLHSCPDGLHFNSSLNVCDWPANAGCDGNATNTTTPKTTTPTTPCDSEPTKLPSTTAETPTSTTTVRTTTTVVPSTTTPKPDPTPSCKPPKTVCTCSCQAVPEDDEPDTTPIWTTKPTEITTSQVTPDNCTDIPENISSDTTPTTTAEPTGQDSCNNLSNQCPDVDLPDSVYIPLAYCGGFCQCSNGQAYYHPCPNGLHFNPTLNVCDFPHRAGCTGVSGTTPNTAATNN